MEQLNNLMNNLYFLYALALLGMVTHFLKKAVQGETFKDIGNFFYNNPKRTIIAWIATTIGFLAYVMMLPVGTIKDVLVIFGGGYTFDSLFNKWDKPE